MRLANMKKKLMVLAGGCTLGVFSVGTAGGCQQIFYGNLLKGVGTGLVGGAVGAVTSNFGADFANNANAPLTNALTATYNNWVDFTFPVLIDQQEIYRQ